jgi:hypothetical protein
VFHSPPIFTDLAYGDRSYYGAIADTISRSKAIAWITSECPVTRAIAFTHLGVDGRQISRLCWFELRIAKIPRRLRTKKKPGDHGTEQTVDGELMKRMKAAQDYVECDPGERKPARPVVAA